MLEDNLNQVTIHLNFTLDYNLDLTFPERTSLDEIEKYILSKFVINNHVDLLYSNQGKLSKNEKSTILGMSKFNEFSVNLNELFKTLIKSNISNDKSTNNDVILYNPPFIPSFLLKIDETGLIGSGSFGKIYKSYYLDKILAVKFLNRENMNTDFENSFDREVNTYIKLSHRNIPKFLGITYVNGKGRGIIMENIEGNKLINLKEVSESLRLQYLIQIAEVIQYLHENNIYHRDLKPDNIIVTEYNEIKLLDYGLSKTSNNHIKITSDISSINTLFRHSDNPYKCPVSDIRDDFYDIWSYGCIVYFLFTGSHPWNGDVNKMKVMYEDKKTFYSHARITNPYIYDIIKACCDYDTKIKSSLLLIKKKVESYLNLLESEKINIIDLNIISSIERTFPSIPELYENLGNSYTELNKFGKAIFCYERLVNLKLTEIGENNMFVADIYVKLGILHYNLSDFTNAKRYIEKACLIILKIDIDNAILLKAYEYVGKIYFIQSIFSQAQDFYQRALNLKLKLYGENSLEVANIYDNFGTLFLSLKESIKATDYFEKSIKIRTELLSKEDCTINTAKLYEIKGIVEMSKTNYSLAKDLFEKSLKIKVSLYGENHLEVINTYSYMGILHQYTGKFNKSLEYFEKNLKLSKDLFGEINFESANSYYNIGNDYYLQGQYTKSIEYFEKSLKIKLQILGELNISIALNYFGIGLAMIGLKDYINSLKNLQNSLTISVSLLGEDHFSITQIYYNIGLVNEKMKNMQEAEEYYKLSKRQKKECVIF